VHIATSTEPVAPLVAPSAVAAALRRSLDALYLGAAALGALAILLIAVLMVAQTLMRLAGLSTGAANDIVAWLAAAAAFLTMAHAFKHGDFVRVAVLLERLGATARRRAELAVLALAAVSCGYLAWWACVFTVESWQFKEVAQGLLALPMWIPQLSFAVGAVLLLVAVLDELLLVAAGSVPTYVRLVAERHAQGDFSSDI
jgi:TRAP-type C4-dicarboxylate transport system permease small subunit